MIRAGSGTILLSFLLGLMLSVYPLPESVQWWRPEWLLLVLIYWVVALPQRVGMATAWVLGLLVDVLEGSLLGLNALSMTIVVYIILLVYQRVRMFSMIQQVFFIFIMVALNQMISHWIKGVLGVSSQSLMFLLPAAISAALWPVIFVALRGVRRQFGIQ